MWEIQKNQAYPVYSCWDSRSIVNTVTNIYFNDSLGVWLCNDLLLFCKSFGACSWFIFMWRDQDGVCGVISVVPNIFTQLLHPLYSSPLSFMPEASLRPQGGPAIHHLTSHLLRTSQPLQHCGEFTACCWQYWSVGLPVWLLTLFSYTVILSRIDIWTNGWFNFKSKWLQQQAVIAHFYSWPFFD